MADVADTGFKSSEFFNHTVIHPVGLAALVVLVILILALPRRFAVLPMLLLVCLIPAAQRIVVFDLDFSFIRILAIAGWARLFFRKELRRLEWTPLDTAFCAWMLLATVVYIARVGGNGALWRISTTLDAGMLYFFARYTIREYADFVRVVQCVLIVAIPTAVFFTIEALTARNLFSMLGGVPEITWERDGRLRCQGAFQHPILAGVFWASLLPLMAAAWWEPRISKGLVALGVVAGLAIIVACASSTPVLGVAIALVGACVFPLRNRMRALRWGLVLFVVLLDIAMKAPIYHLIGRVSVVGGSTGFHRVLLIDAAIKRINEWWLLGANSTAHWGHHMHDITNVYLTEGVRGGIWSLVALLVVLGLAYRQNGMAVRAAGRDKARQVMSWGLGVSLLGHTAMMVAASYYDQILVAWYMTFAIIASLTPSQQTAPARAAARRKSRASPRPRRVVPDLAPAGPSNAAGASLASGLVGRGPKQES